MTANKLGENSVTGPKLAAASVGPGNLAGGAVTSGSIADAAVTARTIGDGAVNPPALAANAVTTPAIANGAVIPRNLASQAVTAGALAPGAISASSLGAETIITTPIADKDAVPQNVEWTASDTARSASRRGMAEGVPRMHSRHIKNGPLKPNAVLAVTNVRKGDSVFVVANDTLIVSIAGIVVSGVVGPGATAWASRRAARSQFNRDQEASRRDELRHLFDEAAELLGAGPTLLRRVRERMGEDANDELRHWSEKVFALGQRLELRLGEGDPAVRQFNLVRELLAASGDGRVELASFESLRNEFLREARSALEKPISDKEPS